MVQLRLLADIVGFDLTHVYLMLNVLDKRGGNRDGYTERQSPNPDNQALLRLTLPECHVFLRALREFHGLIEVTTPILEEAKRVRQTGTHTEAGISEEEAPPAEPSLDEIMERLHSRIAEGGAVAEQAPRGAASA